MKRQTIILLLVFYFLLLSERTVFAARNLIITSNKSTIINDEELIITASSSGFIDNEKIYIKGAFFKDGSSNYFGFTKNSEDWIKNSVTAISQRQIIIGLWDNNLIVKPDLSDNGFTGSGNYKFKLGFYYLTNSGNLSSVNWSSNDLIMNIYFEPSKTPTPSKQKESPLASSTNPVNISKIPTPIKNSIIVPSKNNNFTVPRKSNEGFAKISKKPKTASEYAQIKPVTNSKSSAEVKVLSAKDKRTYAPILFFSGIIFLLAGLSSFIIKLLRDKNIL